MIDQPIITEKHQQDFKIFLDKPLPTNNITLLINKVSKGRLNKNSNRIGRMFPSVKNY